MTAHIFHVGRRDAGSDLATWLNAHLHLPWRDLQQLIRSGRVFLNAKPCLDPSRRLQSGQRIELRAIKAAKSKQQKQGREAGNTLLPASCIHYLDEHIVVVDKPSGLTTMRHAEDVAEFGKRARRYLPPTLADLLPTVISRKEGGKPQPVRAVHRLDRETTGLVVFARTPEAESHLGKQFRAHSTERVYQAIVRGVAVEAKIESRLIADRGDGRRGSNARSEEGQVAVTRVRVVELLGAYSLVECRLETGRTHQVRIHLGEAGTPICGERVYDRPLHGRPAPDGSGIKRIALHAAVLGLTHPATGKRLKWTASLPTDMEELLKRLQRSPNAGSEASGMNRPRS